MTADQTIAAPARSAQQKDRERFVAFAFCWADVLLEIDRDGVIVYAAGTTPTFTGKTPDKLIGTAFVDLVADPDKALARELVAVATKRGRIDDAAVRLTGPNGPTSALALAGYRLTDFDGHYFFALRSTGATAATAAAASAARSGAARMLARAQPARRDAWLRSACPHKWLSSLSRPHS